MEATREREIKSEKAFTDPEIWFTGAFSHVRKHMNCNDLWQYSFG